MKELHATNFCNYNGQSRETSISIEMPSPDTSHSVNKCSGNIPTRDTSCTHGLADRASRNPIASPRMCPKSQNGERLSGSTFRFRSTWNICYAIVEFHVQ